MCVLVDQWKTDWDKSAFFSWKKPSNGDVVAHDLDLLLKVNDSNPNHVGTLNVVISQTVNNIANITNVETYEVAYWLSNVVFTILLGPF